MENPKLKPCPFCQHPEPIFFEGSYHSYSGPRIECANSYCWCKMEGRNFDDKELIEKWNYRLIKEGN